VLLPVTAQNCSICSLVTVHDFLAVEFLEELAPLSLPFRLLLLEDFDEEPRDESSEKSIFLLYLKKQELIKHNLLLKVYVSRN
jgi:hypothetical protein